MNPRFLFRTAGLIFLVHVFANAALAQPVVAVLGIGEEAAPIERRLQNSREVTVGGYVFRVGRMHGRQIVVGRSGAGKVNAAIVTTLLIGYFKPATLFLTGTAGAVDPALHPGDVVIATALVQHDAGVQTPAGILRRPVDNPVTGAAEPLHMPSPVTLVAAAKRAAAGLRWPLVRTPSGQRVPRIVDGVIVTGDVFMAAVVHREELRTNLGAAAIDMEGAAVAQTCRQFRVSCLVVRSISDRADAMAQQSYQRYVVTASENAAALVAAIIEGL